MIEYNIKLLKEDLDENDKQECVETILDNL